jgi:hypothetical protein
MTITFPSTFADHYRAYRAAFHRKPAAWLGYAFFCLLPIGIALAALAKGWSLQELWAQNGLLLLVGPLFALVGVPLLHRMNVKQQRAGNASTAGEQTYAFSADGVRMWGSLSNTSVLWSGVTEVVETKRFFLLYFSAVHFLYIPKWRLSKEQCSELRALLAHALGEQAALAT